MILLHTRTYFPPCSQRQCGRKLHCTTLCANTSNSESDNVDQDTRIRDEQTVQLAGHVGTLESRLSGADTSASVSCAILRLKTKVSNMSHLPRFYRHQYLVSALKM